MHYVHKKTRCGPKIATFGTKTPILPDYTFKLAGKS